MTERELDTIRVELDPAVQKAIRKLYELHLWPLPSPELDCWTFEELAALYFRIELHFDVLPDGTRIEFFLTFLRAHLQDYLHDEHA